MRHEPRLIKRFAAVILHDDLGRGGLCAILMVLFFVIGLPVLLALILPFVVYGGLWLTASSRESPAGAADRQQIEPALRHEPYQICLRLQAEIAALTGQIGDADVSVCLQTVNARFGRILDAIAEDQKYQAALPLLDLIDPTANLLRRYVKVVSREVARPDTAARVCVNLATLETACKHFWAELNRDAIVNLEALNETIDATLQVLDAPPEPSDLPADLLPEEEKLAGGDAVPVIPAGLGPALPSGGHATNHQLTPRELDVLRLLVEARTDQEIGDELFISRRTVTTHVSNICAKLDVDSRTAAAIYAVRHGLV